MLWSDEALELLQKIPDEVRPMAKQMMELDREMKREQGGDGRKVRPMRNFSISIGVPGQKDPIELYCRLELCAGVGYVV